ncbi:hypothetical protein E3Q22_00540 [Wallemia mellicola]|uniref:Uncharacterized protein n=2 Tax=Wallemia mellicola TaxID=1708541 RepID=A0A4T0Q4P1_9BASI|nr:hypothetical protein WALSEDRAFT_31617 [Wallemia mellicola CBS 633.66]TIB72230.1 hypothetical protein E3Q24_01838 [Wallemia mellicola]EIM22938.1 hypothetical protein WALSEDRAFT_31617 [Wallemia mellicola CBS 633.66]TIB81867.1 hypothetical protein E3Q22_00540 [Wallemia mellicola]TIB86147.1 hypothetical protein E3Q21_01724 [Wallemia mellicola]TIB89264.1 hypothetical protein E3Q20_01717 [Wallemia mellicola]|eukprot:XP_006956983.1 hypothetical protein WALSEDRAFT_31617 [Wallemia mellicola CBS 633.66]
MKFSAIAMLAAVASAAPILKRDVPIVSFEDAVASNKNINLVTSDATLPIGWNNDVLTTDQEPITVNFIPASSTFMKYTSDDNTKYGHIVDTATDLHLTVSSPGKASGQTIYSSEGSSSDDSGQMLQFWALDVNSQQVRFLGAPQGADFGEGPFYPESQNEGNGLEVVLTTDQVANLVLA